ncbi:MAG: dehydrogenase [Bacteroidia bacterium]|nr:MAG: dehydrogenase [Bacteroidia bacterium]
MSKKQYKLIDNNDIQWFIELLGESRVISDKALLYDYAHDETEDLMFYPDVVLFPENSIEVSKILKYCNEQLIPVTTRGAGTSLSGGALPVCGGIVLSTRRMNKILKIDTDNFQAIVEPGVINYELQKALEPYGLFYPPDPASWQVSTIGGNVAHASGGPKAVKYGTTRDYVLNLEVVLANGDVIWTGANTLKYSTAYNLTHLFIGSEGTLGVITKIVVKVVPKLPYNVLLLYSFLSEIDACKAVNEILLHHIQPSALEFMERDAIEWSIRYNDIMNVPISDSTQALLLIELEGKSFDQIWKDVESLNTVLEKYSLASDPMIAETEEEKNTLWKIRRKVGEAVKSNSVYKEEDTVVPRAALPELLKRVKDIGKKYGFKSVCYGHAGDGNLHINIIKGEMRDEKWNKELPEAIKEIFGTCKELGGTISGEHGIGWVQKSYLPIVFSSAHFQLFLGIKNTFDPNHILNPNKIFPDQW